MKLRKILARTALLLCGTAWAKDFTVTNQDVQWVDNDDKSGVDTITTSTTDYRVYPSGTPAASFWFDASDTSDWTVSGGAVYKIPSRSGSRFLTAFTSGASWTGWGSTALEPPQLTEDEELGVNVVDFGTNGSHRAMIFDKVDSVNALSTIGTVIMVVNTQAGGGWVMGGGKTALDEWRRTTNWWERTGFSPYNPLADSAAVDGFLHGHTRHNGAEYVASRVGFTGGWEVFTFAATTAARAATLAATGLGVNDGTASGAAASGGMKIAEMIVYDSVLTTAQMEAVEKYLRYKWLKFSAYGENGNARLGELDILNKQSTRNGMTTVLAPADGDTLEVDRVRGGRNVGRFYLTDAQMLEENDKLRLSGSVKLGDTSHFAGYAYFDGGTVSFEPRAIPTVDELPAGLVARFDASVADSLTTATESGTTYVTKMANLATQPYSATWLSLQPSQDGAWDRRPWLQTGWTGTDRPLVDFGDWNYTPSASTHEGRSFGFFTNTTQLSSVPLTTVIAFVDTRRGLGWLMNHGFRGAHDYGAHFTYALMASGSDAVSLSTDPSILSTAGCAYMDGVKVADPFTDGAGGCGFGQKVIAIQVPGATPDRIGGSTMNALGALIFGEMLLWDRPLSELEIRDASAYLAKRWMNKSLPGYERTENTKEIDFENVTITNAACEIVIAPGTDVRFRKLTVSAPLTISGGGLLKVDSMSSGTTSVTMKDGSRIVYGDLSDVTQKCQVASRPGFHFDPTDTRTWTLKTISGEQRVMDVYDSPHDQRLYAANTTGYIQQPKDAIAPRYVTSTFPVGEMPVIDCPGSSTVYGLTFEKPLEVCAAYVVWRPGSVGTFLLGCTGYEMAVALGYTTTYGHDWHRDNYVATPPATNKYYGCLFNTNSGQGMQRATAYTNGVKCASAYYNYMNNNEWYLVEVHPLTPHHVSSLGLERGGAQNVAFGEVILFERELSEREKTATRNYLMKKWFGKSESELEDLPAETTTRAPELDVRDDLTVDGSHSMLIDKLMGGGDVYKEGTKGLEVIHCGSYSGTVHVAGGTMTLSGVPTDPGSLTLKGAALRLDASDWSTVTTRQRGDRCEATRWSSTLDDGFSAKAAAGQYGEGHTYPVTFTSAAKFAPDDTLHLKNVIQMQASSGADTFECYQFMNGSDVWTPITGIRSVLWVLGSHEGGGFLLGGGDTITYEEKDDSHKYYAWHRGDPGSGAYASDPLTCGSGWQASTGWGASWRVNGASVAWNQSGVLSGTWDIVSCVPSQTYPAPASGLAFDGRCLVGKGYSGRLGRQRLAELIVYTNKLSDTELADAENYLAVKWGVRNAVGYTATDMKVELAAGATLDLSGHALTMGGLGGSGTVNGDVTANYFFVDGTASGVVVNGVLTIGANPVFDMSNVHYPVSEVVVATATELKDTANLKKVTYVGDYGKRRPYVVVDGEKIVVRFAHGMIINIR